MTKEEYEYTDKVYDFLFRIAPGNEYLIDNLCKKDSRERFIKNVESFIIATTRQGSYGIEFSEDYNKIRKIKL